MLVELAIGDAYGAGFEYEAPGIVATENTLSAYRAHPVHPLPPGSYTDDTQMTLALAEAMVEGDDWTRESLAERFVDVFRRDPRPGYSRRLYAILDSVKDGREFLSVVKPVSDRSGAAMRATPIGLLPSPDEVLCKTAIQAAITHDTASGIEAAQASALAAHYAYFGLGPRTGLGSYIEDHVPGDWGTPWTGYVGEKGWMSVRAALSAVEKHDSLSAILRAAIAFTGDVDTVGTIAMAVGSLFDDVIDDLPSVLRDDLEAGPFGHSYLTTLDARLFQAYPLFSKEHS